MSKRRAETGTVLRAAEPGIAEFHPPLAPAEAVTEAARCLYCFDAPCTRACPTHIDIPRFIRQILHRDEIGAAKTILDANIFGGSCARVCPTEVLCEGACVDNTMLRAPVRIGLLQRHACDTAHEVSGGFYSAGSDTGRRVAVVGAGPAGLTCAHELRKRGHAVDVFEAAAIPGGLNTVGIAPYKMSAAFAQSEVERALALGAKLHLRKPINGRKLAALLTECDAVFLGIGLGRTAPLGIPGEDLKGVLESLAFIHAVHTKPPAKVKVGPRVVVIGGGNTAIDVARTARQLGANEVTIVYRRDAAAMSAFQHEQDAARAEGVQFEFGAVPQRIVGRGGRAAGVRFTRVKMSGRGRTAKLTPVPRSAFTIAADTVIRALGQEPVLELLRALPGLAIDKRGRVVAERETGATSVRGLFAGGDCRAGAGEEVVNAVQDGKTAAGAIHQYLQQQEGSR